VFEFGIEVAYDFTEADRLDRENEKLTFGEIPMPLK
jgi:hypothetical protein